MNIKDFNNPFDAIKKFEKEFAEYTGAPYAVTTDCCTHALELAFRVDDPKTTSFPARTYLSVPMLMHKLDIEYTLVDQEWKGSYCFENTRIWDCARHLEENMYVPGQIQCLSFGRTKPLEIGVGGIILTDDYKLYKKFSRMRYDGRDIFEFSPWADQEIFEVGYHYYMRPEEAVIGLSKLQARNFTQQLDKYYNYPDCRTITINKSTSK